jgi:antirestriction protein ArdC
MDGNACRQHLGRVNISNPSPMPAAYAQITARIVAELEKGTVPWKRPWHQDSGLPASAVTGRPYRGVNLLLLSLSPFADHRWLTYRQALSLGGNVRRGERATEVVFWKPTDVIEEGGEAKRRPPILRTYKVFNVLQCEGIAVPALSEETRLCVEDRIPRAETVLRFMPSPPKVEEGQRSAWYSPSNDLVGIPALGSFESADSYYATLFHELGHSTGHPSRLNRAGVVEVARFGSADYSREELVAELCSAFLCASIGLDGSLIENAASYIDGWLKALKADARALVSASGQAQRAADWLLGKTPVSL